MPDPSSEQSSLQADFDALIEATSLGVMFVNPDLRLRAINAIANNQLMRLRGKRLKIGDSLTLLEDHADLSGFTARIARTLQGETIRVDRHFETRAGIFYILLHYQPVVDADGRISGVCITSEDITEKRASEIAFRQQVEIERQLTAMRARFIATTSHEFRTPLTSILSSAELVKDYRTRMNDAKLDEHLLRIISQVKAMNTLIDKVLTLGKAQSGTMTYTPQRVDIDSLCRLILAESIQGLSSIVQVIYVCEHPCGDRWFDVELLRLIISNLVENAIKYSGQGGDVLIELYCTPEITTLLVRDYGIGIPARDLPYLYTPFHRGSNTGLIGGSGLGLSIAHSAVELHGGSIRVDSKEGEGTRFTVSFPAQVPA